MTNEEAILHMILRREELKNSVGDLDEDIKAFDMAIQALEQEPCDKYIKEIDHLRKYISKLETQIVEQKPCEDAISRSEVLDLIESKDPNYEVRHFKEDVECLPPISSHESKTVLYSGDGYADGHMVYDMAECPNCGYEYEEGDKDWGLPFCPNCGQSLNWESEVEE